MNDDPHWTPTRRGGYRRSHARVAQATGTPEEATEHARGVATPNADDAVESGQYLEERHSDEVNVGGSSPSPGTSKKFIIAFNEKLGLPSCPYVIRWRVETPWGSIRLHHWLAPDDDRAPHDHPWWFVTFVLKGGYVDRSGYSRLHGGTGYKSEHLKAPAVRYRPAEHQHTVFPDEGGCWTIIVTGPKVRNWGFWVNGKFRSHIKYFWKFGHHPCD